MSDATPAAAGTAATPTAKRDGREQWEPVGALADLDPGTLRTWKRRHHQLVLIRTSAGDVHALDNRCPHEGYPLEQGDLRECTLTCSWHNWKFDVRDGSCLLGGEDARAYPVRVRDGAVEVDLADPPAAILLPRLHASLERALFDADTGRAIRDGARILQAGCPPATLLAEIARYDAVHAEDGSTHVLALAADCGRLLPCDPGPHALHAIAPVIDLCAETNARMPERPRPPALPGGDATTLRDAVRAEDAATAEGLLRGALAAGTPLGEIESWLYAVLADHFLDFGHPLIYLVKAGELLDRIADRAGRDATARDLYPALLHGIVLGTREDRLPYMRGYFHRLDAIAPELERSQAAARADTPFDPIPVRDAVLDGTAAAAVDTVVSTLARGVPAAQVARALVAAAAHRLLRFDERWDADPEVAESWLWATHRLTFASAVRNAVLRFPSAAGLRFLFQAAAFIHSGRGMDAPPARRLPTLERAVPERAGGDAVAAVISSVHARDSAAAVEAARRALRHGETRDALRDALLEHTLRGRFVLPIFTAHAIKTTVAAFEEHAAAAGDPDRDVPVLAAVRFLASPVHENDLHATVQVALRWVVDGKVPRKLTQ